MMQFKNCGCCGCSLRTGSIVIGIASAACALGALAGDVGSAHVSSWSRAAGDSSDALLLGFSKRSPEPAATDSHAIFALLHLLGVIEAFHFNFSLMLLYGIWKNRRSLLKLWVRFSIAATILRLVFVLPIIGLVLVNDYVVGPLAITALVLTATAIDKIIENREEFRKIIQDDQIRFQEKPKSKRGAKVSEERKKATSERMKEYWRKRKEAKHIRSD